MGTARRGLCALVVCGLAGCREAPPPPPAQASAPPTTSTAPAPPTSAPSAGPIDPKLTTDPERVCVEPNGTITVEHDCGCNDALLCNASATSAGNVWVVVRKDPNRMPMCTDCFPMVPGTCAMPATAEGPTRVRAGNLELQVELHEGRPASRACAAARK